MSTGVALTSQPAIKCSTRIVGKCAPRAYLFRNHDLKQPSHRHRQSHVCQPDIRGFSTSTPRAVASQRQVKQSHQSQPSQPSVAVQLEKMKKQALRSGDIPEDIGVVPGTFIMPTGRQLPNWTSNWRDRWKLEKARMLARLQQIYMYIAFRLQLSKHPSLLIISSIAKELHKEMFANFAKGDLSPVENNLCSGILTSLRSRIDQRPPNTSYLWRLLRYDSQPKLVSYNAMPFPETAKLPKNERHGIIQAIVRIHTLQSLMPVKHVPVKTKNGIVMKEMVTTSRGEDKPLELFVESPESTAHKAMVEYVVLQQMYKKATPGPWKIWGMAEETTVRKLKGSEKERKISGEIAKAEKRGPLRRLLRLG